MSVDTQKIIEIVKQVKPLFLAREGSSQGKGCCGFCDTDRF